MHKNGGFFELRTMPAIGNLQKFRTRYSIREFARERRRRRGVERAEQNLIMEANAARLLKIRR